MPRRDGLAPVAPWHRASPDWLAKGVQLRCRMKQSHQSRPGLRHLLRPATVACMTYQPKRTPESLFLPIRGLQYHLHTWGDASLAPVSYTHLTLPTNREV